MYIKVKGHADMKKYTAHLPPEGDLEIADGATVEAVLNKLKVPSESKKLIIVNGHHQSHNYILQPGDSLVLFPPIEGG